MKLPNADLVLVEEQKVVGYLLNRGHRYGASKARFFGDFGFHVGNWQALAEALRAHGRNCDIVKTKETPFGPRFEVEGPLYSPDGRQSRVRTVWQLDAGQIAPRLITAYPLEADYD